jgi:hypothetical protein
MLHDLAAEDPNFDADNAVSRFCLSQRVINIRAQRM